MNIIPDFDAYNIIGDVTDSYKRAFRERERLARLKQVGDEITKGNYLGGSNLLLGGGDLEAGIALAKLGQQSELQRRQLGIDSAALAAARGGERASGPTGLSGAGLGTFQRAVERTLGFEGGLNRRDTNGTPSNFGINQAAHPEVNVRNINRETAQDIYRTDYWNRIDGDKLASVNPSLAHVAFDTAVIAGVDKAQELIRQSGGDPSRLLDLREQFQNRLVNANPDKYKPYAAAWQNRINALRQDVAGNAPPQEYGPQFNRLLAERTRLVNAYSPGMSDDARSTLDRLVSNIDAQIRESHARGAARLAERDTWRDVSPESVGAPSDFQGIIQRNSSGEVRVQRLNAPKPAGITINNAGENEFDKQTGKLLAQEFSEIHKSRGEQATNLALVSELQNLGNQLRSGKATGLQNWISNTLGINIGENTPTIEAYNAIISILTPQQRQNMPGAVSDRDIEMFRSMLPRLSNTPAGNKLIESTLKALAQRGVDRGNIAGEVLRRKISPTDGLEKIDSLPDPFIRVREERQREKEKVFSDAIDHLSRFPQNRSKVIERIKELGYDPRELGVK